VDIQYDVRSISTHGTTTMVINSITTMARGSPVRNVRPHNSASPQIHGSATRNRWRAEASGLRRRNLLESASISTIAQGMNEKPCTTPKWTIWPIIAPE
jgi:hypothetical protein